MNNSRFVVNQYALNSVGLPPMHWRLLRNNLQQLVIICRHDGQIERCYRLESIARRALKIPYTTSQPSSEVRESSELSRDLLGSNDEVVGVAGIDV